MSTWTYHYFLSTDIIAYANFNCKIHFLFTKQKFILIWHHSSLIIFFKFRYLNIMYMQRKNRDKRKKKQKYYVRSYVKKSQNIYSSARSSTTKKVKYKTLTKNPRKHKTFGDFECSLKLLQNYLLLNCGARRAAFSPYFFLSFILGSRVK